MPGAQKPNTLKHRAVLALGSNLGESEDTLERAVADLVAGGVQLVRASGLYRTAPVGGPAGQPDFVNASAGAGACFCAGAVGADGSAGAPDGDPACGAFGGACG